jgi:hypothetical protein
MDRRRHGIKALCQASKVFANQTIAGARRVERRLQEEFYADMVHP